MDSSSVDVLVIGGGPAGATAATVLKKYNPELQVVLVERETFPRYHIGESLVLEVNRALQDSGALDYISQAGFLKKGGATYVWGEDRKPWTFLFSERTAQRPHFDGIASYTWHVDRARFDTLLLEHAQRMGVRVLQPATVLHPITEGDTVVGVRVATLEGERTLRARFTIDASGRSGLLARRFGARKFDPVLRNVATFGYWKDARLDADYLLDWELSAIGIITIPIGWLWYIPIQPGVVSVGVVTSSERFRSEAAKDVQSFYLEHVMSAPEVKAWLSNAELVTFPGAPSKVMVEQDFNYINDKAWGPGWAAVGDALGFVDPLFTFGVFLSTTGAQLLGYCLGTMLDGRYPGATAGRLLDAYQDHIRTYYDAFTAMVYIFYGFNSSKENFWSEARNLLHAHALPAEIGDRDAFKAFTFGYGVNTMLFHEATQHFGHVSLHRIREMCLSEDLDKVEMSDPGEYGKGVLSDTTRVRLKAKLQSTDSVVPVVGTGRVIPMSRVSIESDGVNGARFPRHMYLPEQVLTVISQLDGSASLVELRNRLSDSKTRLGDRVVEHGVLLAHALRALVQMGAAEVVQD